MLTKTNEIETRLKELPYLFEVSKFYSGWEKILMGYNVSASSLLRKRFTMVRVKEEIDKNNWPLEVDDCWGSGYVAFRLVIKND